MEKKDKLTAPQKVLQKLKENKDSLHIGRIPPKTKKAFVTFAEEEYCGDFGMALKGLIDDVPHQDIRMLVIAIEDLDNRICALESKLETSTEKEPNEKSCKMCDGKERRI